MELSSSSFASIFLSSFLLTGGFALMQPLCHSEERSALLQFKQSFFVDTIDSTCSSAFPILNSWKVENGKGNCCSWDGVECDNITGYVIGLDLSHNCLYGSIDSNSSLFQLVHLQQLNLSFNNFNYSQIPASIGKLSELRYLNLSSSVFAGQIPFAISKLNKLLVLDFSYNVVGEISGDQSLLKLKNPDLRTLIQNLTSLEVLSLRFVDVSSTLLDFLANFSSLKVIDMQNCGFYGNFPEKIFLLQNLQVVNVMDNLNLYGYLPEFNSSSVLKTLWLCGTRFYGRLPISIGNLFSLTYLNIQGCEFLGSIPFSIGNLTELKHLDLSFNKFSTLVPTSLGNLTKLVVLRLGHNNFSDITTLSWLPKQLISLNLEALKLHDNTLYSLGDLTKLKSLSIFNTQMVGQFPSSIRHLSSLVILEMGRNVMIGMLPQWLGNFSRSLKVLDLSDNMFKGNIPNIFATGNSLTFIDLSNNQLQGKLPRSFSNCEMLEFIDLGSNRLSDVFPYWLGTLPNLRFLVLQSNRFYGAIGEPKTGFEFPKLHIIDLSRNNFSNNLPSEYINLWSAMKKFSSHSKYISVNFTVESEVTPSEFYFEIRITNKHSKRLFPKIIDVFSVIDLSCNRFDDQIPNSIGSLTGLQSLNLSYNMLTGPIPSSLVNLKQLEALDLSHNKLSGNIPSQLSQLTFLEVFDVSYNNLSGPIPQGSQLDRMESSSYDGNPNLCGRPLPNQCGDSRAKQALVPIAEEDYDDQTSIFELDWKIALIGYGCGMVFGIVVGICIITRKQEWFFKTFGIIPNWEKDKSQKWRLIISQNSQ